MLHEPTALQKMMAPTGGMFRIVPMMRQEIVNAMNGADVGDPLSTILASAALSAHCRVEAAEGAQGCIGCACALTGRPRSYAVVVSDPPLLGRAFAAPVCEACGPEPAAIIEAVKPFLRTIWPGVRDLPACAFAQGGRA